MRPTYLVRDNDDRLMIDSRDQTSIKATKSETRHLSFHADRQFELRTRLNASKGRQNSEVGTKLLVYPAKAAKKAKDGSISQTFVHSFIH